MPAKKKMRPLTERQKKLVEDNIGLVGYVIKKNGRMEATAKDEMQDDSHTLIRAAKLFKKNRGVMFSTYAVNAIKKELIRKRCEDGVIRVPEYLNYKKYAVSRFQGHAEVARSIGSIDAAIEVDEHPVAPNDDEAEFGYQAMRAVRWAIYKLQPVERDVIRSIVIRGESPTSVGKRHGLNYHQVGKVKLQAFAKLRASLQKHV